MVMLVESMSELVRALLAKASPVPRSDVIGVRRNVLKLMRQRDADAAICEMRAHFERLDRLLEASTSASGESSVDHADTKAGHQGSFQPKIDG